MALNKSSKNYCYNIGRAVAIVEIVNNLRGEFAAKVHDNASANLPYQLREALKNNHHILHHELVESADVTLNGGELPSKDMATIDKVGSYWIGYYHEKSYLADTYNGIYAKEEIIVSHHTPERMQVDADADNTINELKR